MIEFEDIQVDASEFEIRSEIAATIIPFQIRNWVNDLAEEVQRKAQEFAPIGAPPPMGSSRMPGQLKKEGILRTEVHRTSGAGDGGVPGEEVTGVRGFAAKGENLGPLMIRGGNPLNTGQFSRATRTFAAGHVFTGGFGGPSATYTSSVFLNPAVRHAKWVHGGTGLYGRFHRPIVPTVASHLVFWYRGRKWALPSVRGQHPNPFLTEAYEYVNNIYAPAKLSELRAEIQSDL
jgi:hypothetical protein